ncbi:hypothetical protein GCM10009624_19440 [Gordonia sinesedis]
MRASSITVRILVITSAVAVGLATLSGCSEPGAPSGESGAQAAESGAQAAGPNAPAASATTSARPIDPCAGVAGECVYVADADVDGDGNADQIGIARQGATTTTIVGINGTPYKLDQTTTMTNAYSDPRDIYRGAFLLSRAVGSDIAVHLVPGEGNAEQFAVISWDGKKLVTLPQPQTADRTGAQVPGIWYLGSSHGRQDFIACRQPGEIAVVRLTAATSEGQPVPGGGRREENFYTFAGNAWQPAGSNNVADSSFSYNWNAHEGAFQCDNQGTAR